MVRVCACTRTRVYTERKISLDLYVRGVWRLREKLPCAGGVDPTEQASSPPFCKLRNCYRGDAILESFTDDIFFGEVHVVLIAHNYKCSLAMEICAKVSAKVDRDLPQYVKKTMKTSRLVSRTVIRRKCKSDTKVLQFVLICTQHPVHSERMFASRRKISKGTAVPSQLNLGV